MLIYFTTKDIERFWSKVSKSDDPDQCWEWMAGKVKQGYGQFKLKDRHIYAHRISYELMYGQIPDGLKILHMCDNPSCVNPLHLFADTQKANVEDMFKKGRANRAKGERNNKAKLTWEQVRKIRSRYGKGGISQKRLAREYNISQSTVGKIINNETWIETDSHARNG